MQEQTENPFIYPFSFIVPKANAQMLKIRCNKCHKVHSLDMKNFELWKTPECHTYRFMSKIPFECKCGNKIKMCNSLPKLAKRIELDSVLFIALLIFFSSLILALIIQSYTDYLSIAITLHFISLSSMVVLIPCMIMKQTHLKKQNERVANAFQETQEEYDFFKKNYILQYEKIKLGSNVHTEYTVKIDSHLYYIWLQNNALYLFKHQEQLPEFWNCMGTYPKSLQAYPQLLLFRNDKSACVELPSIVTFMLSKIEYFTKDGEVYREQIISGGGGGGSSLGGAVVGGALFGATGAIIGSRKATEGITSETIEHDNRHTILQLTSQTIKMDSDAYSILNKLIPEKEYTIVQELKKQSILRQHNAIQQTSIAEQIKDLAKLRDDNILTETEFNQKKTELLAKI